MLDFNLPSAAEYSSYQAIATKERMEKVNTHIERLWENVREELLKNPNEFDEHTIFHKFICPESVIVVKEKLKEKGFTVKEWPNQPIFDFYKSNRVCQNEKPLSKDELRNEVLKTILRQDNEPISIFVNKWNLDDVNDVMHEMRLIGIKCWHAGSCAPAIWIRKMTKVEYIKMKVYSCLGIYK